MADETSLFRSVGGRRPIYDPFETVRDSLQVRPVWRWAVKILDSLVKHWLWFGLLPLPMLTWWAMDREPPLRILTSAENIRPKPVRPGEVAIFVAPVWRDSSRECDAIVSRYLIDGAGRKFDLPGGEMNAESIDIVEAKMGPFLKIAVDIPRTASPGESTLLSNWAWKCNPVHAGWTIKGSAAWPITILEKLKE